MKIDYKKINDDLYNYLEGATPYDFNYIRGLNDIIVSDSTNFSYQDYKSYIKVYDSLKLTSEFFKTISEDYSKYFERKLYDGTMDISYEHDFGLSYYDVKNQRKQMLIPIENNIHDSFVMIHELFHNKNLVVNSESITRHLFTESISILGELLYRDYLIQNNLYNHDARKHINDLFWSSKRIAMQNDFEIKFMDYFLNYGYVDRDVVSWLSFDKKNEYNWQIVYSLMDINKNGGFNFDDNQRYSIGILFASYMHQRILKDKNKLLELIEINEFVNEIYYADLMNYLDLNTIDEDSYILDKKSLKKLELAYKKELKIR